MTDFPRISTLGTAVVIAALDGTTGSDGALRAALARTNGTGATLEVLMVVPGESDRAGAADAGAWNADHMAQRVAARCAVDAQIERVTGMPRRHPVTIVEGNPAYTISRVAIQRRAALVVVGIGRHLVLDRMFSDETALQLARIARVPVLAVPEDGRSPARHAVVAVALDEMSERIAQAAVEAVGDAGTVELVHVLPALPALEDDEVPPDNTGEAGEAAVHCRLGALALRLIAPVSARIETTVLRGHPARVILTHAERRGASLLVTGTHGRGFVARTVFGSVATALLRGSRTAVLVLPRDPIPALASMEGAAFGVIGRGAGPSEWSETLRDFARRNAGRRTILEVDDPELDAHGQEFGYRLLDTRCEEGGIAVLLGGSGVSARQLLRRIVDVSAVDVTTDRDGHDVALRVQHGSSQTLLTFAA